MTSMYIALNMRQLVEVTRDACAQLLTYKERDWHTCSKHERLGQGTHTCTIRFNLHLYSFQYGIFVHMMICTLFD